jgi:hypothetical protein
VELAHHARLQRFFHGRTAQRATAETVAMGDLSRGQKERDSTLKGFVQDRDRSESCGKNGAHIVVE